MTMIKRGTNKRRRHKKLLKATKGHQGVRHTLYRARTSPSSTRWRIPTRTARRRRAICAGCGTSASTPAARANGTTYSRLIHGLKLAGIEINRKMLADIAIRDPEAFAKIAEQAKAQLEPAA